MLLLILSIDYLKNRMKLWKLHLYNIDMRQFFIDNKYDIIKFIIYFTFFIFLFSAFQIANSPVWEVTYNSATDINKTEVDTDEDSISNFVIWKKATKKPSLTISFNPDYIKIDTYLMDSLKLNVNSKYFKEKVVPLDLTVDSTRIEPRGQVVWKKLIISGKIKNLKESVKVFVHELWHIIDLHYLQNLWDYDPSENFYNISWLSYQVKKKNAKLEDFVSWYALTNKYEDFAESFCFYVFHNEEFKLRAKKNLIIARKYNFFSKYVFASNDFQNTYFENTNISSYNWDTTKIWINLKKYLYYIK